jgi:endonuclease/exonuclease/phosphatase family metal-dependent hydrolase
MDRVRVGTYNLYLGADLSLLLGVWSEEQLEANRLTVQDQLGTTAFPRRAPAVARLLADHRLDLVGLQEVCTWSADGEPLWDFAADLVRALDDLGEPYDVVAGQPTFEGAGLVPLDGRLVELHLQGSNTILRRRGSPVEVESTSVGIFESALTAPVLGRMQVSITRGWCSARCSLRGDNGTTFTFVDTHTEAYDEESRDRQRDELLAVLPGEEERLVVVGDFNSTPDRVGMPAAFVDAWTAAGHPSTGPGAGTCGQAADLRNPESRLRDRIDYVWVRGLTVRSSTRFGADPADRTGDGLWPSDHAGVAAELEL